MMDYVRSIFSIPGSHQEGTLASEWIPSPGYFNQFKGQMTEPFLEYMAPNNVKIVEKFTKLHRQAAIFGLERQQAFLTRKFKDFLKRNF